MASAGQPNEIQKALEAIYEDLEKKIAVCMASAATMATNYLEDYLTDPPSTDVENTKEDLPAQIIDQPQVKKPIKRKTKKI